MSPGLTDVYYELKIVSRGPTSDERLSSGDAPVAEGKPRGKFRVDFTRPTVNQRSERFHELWTLWQGQDPHDGQDPHEALDPSFPNLPTDSKKGVVTGPFEVEIIAYYPGKVFL